MAAEGALKEVEYTEEYSDEEQDSNFIATEHVSLTEEMINQQQQAVKVLETINDTNSGNSKYSFKPIF